MTQKVIYLTEDTNASQAHMAKEGEAACKIVSFPGLTKQDQTSALMTELHGMVDAACETGETTRTGTPSLDPEDRADELGTDRLEGAEPHRGPFESVEPCVALSGDAIQAAPSVVQGYPAFVVNLPSLRDLKGLSPSEIWHKLMQSLANYDLLFQWQHGSLRGRMEAHLSLSGCIALGCGGSLLALAAVMLEAL